jgi:hypothetical protein
MSEICYLTADLDVWVGRDIGPLVEAMASCGVRSHHPPHAQDGQSFAMFGTITTHTAPEANLSEMLAAIESLSGDAAALWAECSLREFNIGYDCGDKPWAYNDGFSNALLRRMAAAGTTLRITLYPPEAASEKRRPRAKGARR